MEKERLDILLVQRGFFQSREKARSSIMAGVVMVNNNREDKPGTKFCIDANIHVKEDIIPYVSRGGLKLEKALLEFSILLKDKIAIDIGASTGGFTDCMLKNGAKKVYAIDVGYGQLAWELRNDPRVVCMERTNIRYVKPENLEEKAQFASIDVSFISLKKVLPAAKELLDASGELVCLIKPQFEAGREKVGKHGVVRDPDVHIQVISDILGYCEANNFIVKHLTFSPIRGPEGNIEYLTHIQKTDVQQNRENLLNMITEVVEQSHITAK